MNKEDLFNHYEKIYFHEIDARGNLDSRLQMLLSIIVILAGLAIYSINNTPPTDTSLNTIFYWSLYLISVFFLGRSIYFFVKSWHGYTYQLLATPEDIDEYKQDLIEFYKNDKDCDRLVEETLRGYMYEKYKDYATYNVLNNDVKALHQHNVRVALTISFVLLILSFIPYYMDSKQDSKNVKVEHIIKEKK